MVMPDNQMVTAAFDEIYNKFWLRYRDRPLSRHSDDWERIHTMAVVLVKKYPFQLAEDMVRDFLDILEGRVKEKETICEKKRQK